ncbi:Membrane protein insertion efficiency factor YidD [hydrothermal vent metagenome]|uniref:Membrane protein insertion efficiency factor YidD n=1 Tax=hydrothermal vent metagenome TaxID=652676 RepID=A0A3B0R9D3_9ZZZZ
MILLNWLLKALITVYRYTLSPLLGKNCRYLPTCSEYAAEAIDRFGAFKGGLLAIRRIGRCHPWGGHGFDPVPEKDNDTE